MIFIWLNFHVAFHILRADLESVVHPNLHEELVLLTGEGDSGSGASTPDEHLPGQTYDHPQRRNVTQSRTVADQQHSSLQHPIELLSRHPSCGGERFAQISGCLCRCRGFSTPPLTCLHLFLQVDASASKLNTNDVFVLKTPTALFVWRGVGASDEEMEASKHVVSLLGGSPTNVPEGKEPGQYLLWTNSKNLINHIGWNIVGKHIFM